MYACECVRACDMEQWTFLPRKNIIGEKQGSFLRQFFPFKHTSNSLLSSEQVTFKQGYSKFLLHFFQIKEIWYCITIEMFFSLCGVSSNNKTCFVLSLQSVK